MAAAPRPSRTAADGSPYPDRARPSFERDVRAMFTYIARGYDWFDHVISLGGDLIWRPRALWDLDRFRSAGAVQRVLDLGCGPGSLTVLAATHYPQATVVGADFTDAMLRQAVVRHARHPAVDRMTFTRADAGALPFADGSFDVAMTAYMIRSLPDLGRAFRELHRTLAPGGALLVLEISEPENPLVARGFHAFFDRVVPFLGGLIRSEGPYRYLPESLKSLPERAEILGLLTAAGFPRIAARPQSMGIVTSFLAEKARDPPQALRAVSPHG
jgi:demethylmenaquinone methyltransferase/2-methoxy-6-polyprenyl-1,4-benzoquinol methylase